MLKTKALNKTVTTTLILLLTLSILSVINLIAVHATSITYMDPTSGPVGTTVTIRGTIDTYAGAYKIYFDSNADGSGAAGEVVKEGTAVGTTVDTTFTVPHSINGTRVVWLNDVTSNANGTANFVVGTKYYLEVVQAYGQIDYTNITIIANVTGGTIAPIPIQINVTKPDGSKYLANVTLVTNATGFGEISVGSQTRITNENLNGTTLTFIPSYPATYILNFTKIPALDSSETVNMTIAGDWLPYYNGTGFVGMINNTVLSTYNNTLLRANYTYLNFTTPYCGTYNVTTNVTSPYSVQTSDTFKIVITNATSYRRGDWVELKTTEWSFTTPQQLNFTIYYPEGTIANTTALWVNATGEVSDLRTANYTWRIPSTAQLGTYNVTVTNMTAGLNKTALGVPDTSTFAVEQTGVLQFTNVTSPSATYQRTAIPVWRFNVTYPDGSSFTSANKSMAPVYVYWNETQIATATVNYMSGPDWNATWAIPKDQGLAGTYKFVIPANSWNDTLNNQGPASFFNSTTFAITAAILTVTWYSETLANYNVSSTPVSWQNRTKYQNCTFRVTYPDSSVLTDTLASVLNVTVWNGTLRVANFTEGDLTYDGATGNWTVKWYIPYNVFNATDASRYVFRILANFAEDIYANKGFSSDSSSLEFKVTPAVITVLSISTTQSSYARGTTAYVQFTATYPDGSAVTTGQATITLILPDATPTTITATYSATALKFQATYYLDFAAQLGTWNANLTAYALNDTINVAAPWYPGNIGPNATRTTTFTVTESTLLLEINATVTDLEVKLDNSVFGLSAIKAAIVQVQTTINAVGTKVDAIYSEVTNSTYGLVAIKNAVDAINFTSLETKVDAIKLKTDTINWADITTIKSYVQVINWTDITAIKAELAQVKKSDWWDLVHLIHFRNMVQFAAGTYSTTAPTSTAPVNLAKSSKVTLTVRATDDTTAGFKVNAYIYDGTTWQPLSFSVLGSASADCAATVEFTTGTDGRFYFETAGATFTAFIYSAESAP